MKKISKIKAETYQQIIVNVHNNNLHVETAKEDVSDNESNIFFTETESSEEDEDDSPVTRKKHSSKPPPASPQEDFKPASIFERQRPPLPLAPPVGLSNTTTTHATDTSSQNKAIKNNNSQPPTSAFAPQKQDNDSNPQKSRRSTALFQYFQPSQRPMASVTSAITGKFPQLEPKPLQIP